MDRRQFLKNSLILGGASMLPLDFANAQATPKHVVFIFMRGGADALSLAQPTVAGEVTKMQAFRKNIMSTSPIIHAGLGFHPSLAPLFNDATLKAGLNFALHTGSLNPTRSHFIQQDLIETGSSTSPLATGFLTRAAKQLNRRTIAISATPPKSLSGSNPVVVEEPEALAELYASSVTKPGWSRAKRMNLYQMPGGTEIDVLFNHSASIVVSDFSRIEASMTGSIKMDDLSAKSGYDSTKYAFAKSLAATGALIGSAASPAFITVEAQHTWDTHVGQPTAFAPKVDNLAKNLAAFKRDLVARNKWNDTVVIVMSEFGRTIRANDDNGTDHGEGGLMLLMGAKVKPFASMPAALRTWTLPTSVDSSTALQVKHDYRFVLSEVFRTHLGMTNAQLAQTFAGSEFQNPLNHLGVLKSAS